MNLKNFHRVKRIDEDGQTDKGKIDNHEIK